MSSMTCRPYPSGPPSGSPTSDHRRLSVSIMLILHRVADVVRDRERDEKELESVPENSPGGLSRIGSIWASAAERQRSCEARSSVWPHMFMSRLTVMLSVAYRQRSPAVCPWPPGPSLTLVAAGVMADFKFLGLIFRLLISGFRVRCVQLYNGADAGAGRLAVGDGGGGGFLPRTTRVNFVDNVDKASENQKTALHRFPGSETLMSGSRENSTGTATDWPLFDSEVESGEAVGVPIGHGARPGTAAVAFISSDGDGERRCV
jgi:hypothetical protein